MAVVVHVDLCTNRSGLDNSIHQSRHHNPFLKDRTNGRQQSGRIAQHGTTKPTQNNKTNNTEQQKTGKHGKNTETGAYANKRLVTKHAQQTVTTGSQELSLHTGKLEKKRRE